MKKQNYDHSNKSQQIETEIRKMILSGKGIRENGQFLSERELSEYFKVSRTTIRTALHSLSRQGLLIQMHGSGTFVKDIQNPRYHQSLYSITECAQYYRSQGLTPMIQVLSKEILPATRIVSSYLWIEPGSSVLRIKKLYKANRMIMNVTVSYIALDSFPGAEKCDFRDPIVEVLRASYNAVPRKTENTIEAILPPSEITKDLGVSEATPILLFESVTTGIKDGRYLPLEYYKTYHRTDRLRFSFEQEHEAVRQ
ncbi:MAG: GntR family transcriptional regulator [Bilifractor sp.]|jgi:GntR family transcriptional regulator